MANQASAANTALANMCKIEWVKLEPCLVFLRTVVRLLREKPDQEKYRRLNKKFDKYQELMRDCPAMEQFLLACGFRDMGDFMSLPAKYNPDVAWLIFAEEQLKTAFMRRGKMVFKDETPRTALKNARAAAASPSKPTTVSPAQARGRTDLAPGAGMSGRDARAGRVASSTFSMAPSTLSRSSSAPRPHVVVTGPAGTIGSVCANTKGQSGSTRPRPSLEEARALLWANPPSKVKAVCSFLHSVVGHLCDSPRNTAYWGLKLDFPKVKLVTSTPGGFEFLRSLGFENNGTLMALSGVPNAQVTAKALVILNKGITIRGASVLSKDYTHFQGEEPVNNLTDDHRLFLKWALPQRGLDMEGFVPGGLWAIISRIKERRPKIGLQTNGGMSEYKDYIVSHPDEWKIFDNMCQIHVTRFNRDPRVMSFIADHLLPSCAKRACDKSSRSPNSSGGKHQGGGGGVGDGNAPPKWGRFKAWVWGGKGDPKTVADVATVAMHNPAALSGGAASPQRRSVKAASNVAEWVRPEPRVTVKCWSAGCSTGEEPYSIGILWALQQANIANAQWLKPINASAEIQGIHASSAPAWSSTVHVHGGFSSMSTGPPGNTPFETVHSPAASLAKGGAPAAAAAAGAASKGGNSSSDFPFPFDLKLLGTDYDQATCDTASKGVYSRDDLSKAPQDWMKVGFMRHTGGSYSVHTDLKDHIKFDMQDALKEMPQGPFDCIFARNSIFMYFAIPEQRRLLTQMSKNLLPGGYLVIGSRDVLPDGQRDVKPYRMDLGVYQRV